jgi:cytidyltransferase-like protein
MRKVIGVKSGTFTIITKAHVKCLEFCKRFCDKLIVVLNDDDYLVRKKGFCAVPANERKTVLEGLACVDQVIVYSGDNEQETLRQIRAEYDEDNYTLSIFHSIETHDKEFIPGDDIADRMIFCPHVESSSTSDIMDRIIRGMGCVSGSNVSADQSCMRDT